MQKLVDDYIEYKHARGYKIVTEGTALKRFSRFADSEHPGQALSSSLALNWIDSIADVSDWYRARLYEIVRTFSRYACIVDAESTQLPKGRGRCHGVNEPYIYTDEEVVTLMGALSEIYSPDGLRAKSASAMCGLMRACGLRPSECTRLTIGDYDSSSGVLSIIATKFNRSRRVPLSDSCAAHMESHLSAIPAHSPDLPIFPRTGGRPFDVHGLGYAWQITRDALLPAGQTQWSRRPPRPYDCRHAFATRTLEGWLASGVDVDAMMPYLSAYLGHRKIADTYWYLTATDVLLDSASNMFKEYAAGGRHD